ncbi:MAG: hypothetical protein PHH43_06720 [Candidatus Cloacimonetes bacterium]|nr:hypothetical protein [Candidatus Cloacimonadota bacterium]
MILYPLIISILAVMNPFLGLVLLLSYSAKNMVLSMANPIKALLLFFPVPLGFLFLDANPGTQVMAMDAIFAVGGVSLIFLYMLKRGNKINDAFLVANLGLLVYGLLRYKLFGTSQAQMFDQGLEMLNTQMPTLVNNAMFTEALPLWKAILPSVWVITQSIGFVLGFILFQRLLKIPSILQSLSFPGIYNLLIIAIIPLYLIEQTKMLFLNALLALCVIPFLQGISSVWQRLGLVFANRVVLGILMFVIILYAHIMLVLLGFADMWINERKEIPGGITA